MRTVKSRTRSAELDRRFTENFEQPWQLDFHKTVLNEQRAGRLDPKWAPGTDPDFSGGNTPGHCRLILPVRLEIDHPGVRAVTTYTVEGPDPQQVIASALAVQPART